MTSGLVLLPFVCQGRPCALADQFALHLREAAKEGEYETAVGGRGVERLGDAVEFDLPRQEHVIDQSFLSYEDDDPRTLQWQVRILSRVYDLFDRKSRVLER